MKQSLRIRRPGLWSLRDFRLAVPGRTLSIAGDSITLVVLSLRVAESHEPFRMTVLLMAFALPLFALAPVAGRIVDEFDSRTVLVGAGLLQVFASLGLVLAPGFASIVGFVLVLQAGQSVTNPAWSALLPRIVGEERVGQAMGLTQSLASFAGLVGSALGGVLYAFVGYRETLLLDTASFAVLVVVGASVRTRRGRRHDMTSPSHSGPVEGGGPSGGAGGWSYIRSDALLKILFPVLCLIVVVFEVTNVVEVFLIRDSMGASTQMYGAATAVLMLGSVVGPTLAGRVTSDRRRVAYTSVACASVGAMFAAIGLSPTIWPALVPLFLAGIAVGALNTLLSTLMVTRTPDRLRGRVMATLNGTLRGFTVVAMVLGGVCGQLLGPRATFVAAGIASVLVAPLVLGCRRGIPTTTAAPVAAE